MNTISVGVWTYGMGSDRYVDGGYKNKMDLKDRIKIIGETSDASGIEITYPSDINEKNYSEYKALLDKYNIKIAAMGVEIVCDKYWATGSLASHKKDVRLKAIELIKSAMDFSESIGRPVINLWFGQDGFDYLFQTDYIASYSNLISGLRECADHNNKIKLSIEYKCSEPRLQCFVNSGGKALSICQSINRDNVGVTMDIGHAFNAKENPAETAAFIMKDNKLFHIHLNDNYVIADDDMPVGSVHYIHFMEFFYWLKRLGYEGWYSLDMYPYRDDSDEAVKASIKFINGMNKFIDEKLKDYEPDIFKKPSEVLNFLYSKMFD